MRHPLLNAFVFNHAPPQQASNGKQANAIWSEAATTSVAAAWTS
jgi:hypothetical protein